MNWTDKLVEEFFKKQREGVFDDKKTYNECAEAFFKNVNRREKNKVKRNNIKWWKDYFTEEIKLPTKKEQRIFFIKILINASHTGIILGNISSLNEKIKRSGSEFALSYVKHYYLRQIVIEEQIKTPKKIK